MSEKIKEISSSQLELLLEDKNAKIIDIRDVNSYNGWKMNGQHRSGHIKGAKSLHSKWSKYIDWIEIVRSKNILPENKIIVYGAEKIETERIAQLFLQAGYPDVSVYHQFINEWTADDKFAMNYLPKYRQLVSAEWLKQLLETNAAPEYNNNKFVLCHAHYRNPDAYNEGHIPGAIEIDTNTLESPETWNRRSPEEIKHTLELNGITCDTTVILYGRFAFPNNDDDFPGSSAGHLGAMRCAFIMLYAGVKDVRILNGGLQSWIDAGYEISDQETKKSPVSNFGAEIPSFPKLAVDTPEAKEMIVSQQANLVCVRSYSELIGEVSGYNYIKAKGRIPGSVFGNCGTDAYHMENYRNLDHTTRESQEIIENWNEAGITPDKHNAFYCGTGWRGSEAFINAWLLDWPKISVYDGGWFEWSNNPDNPFETGIPAN